MKMTPAATREIRRLALDVVLLDGEQDAAPSLGDMATRAKALLAGPLRETRRPVKVIDGISDRKRIRAQERKERAAEIRAAVMARADGFCEFCASDGYRLEWHHLIGGGLRRYAEATDNTAAVCPDCHRAWERGDMSAFMRALVWAREFGTAEVVRAVENRIAKLAEASRAAGGGGR